MIYTKLGKSDLNVSRICMGCMGIGDPSKGMNKWAVPEEESREIIRYALDQGINFFDTAMSYQEGNSEEVLGKALKDFAKRDDYIVATKFLPRSQEELDRNVPGQAYVEDCLDRSLKRLGLDYVDLYIYHMWDYHTPMEEIIEGLNNAVKAGKESKNVLMTEISLAWLLRKVTAPVMGVTKKSNIDGAVKAVELEFTQEETDYLEELYVPHALAGVMAQNGKQKAGDVVKKI